MCGGLPATRPSGPTGPLSSKHRQGNTRALNREVTGGAKLEPNWSSPVGSTGWFEWDANAMAVDIVAVCKRLWAYRVDELREYIERTEAGITADKRQLEGRFANDDDAGDLLYDQLELVQNIVPRYVRYSQLLMIYSICEHSAGELCQLVAHKQAQKAPQKIYLQRAKEYLVAVGVEATVFGRAWRYIENVRLVRNAIAHGNGVVEDEKEDAIAFIDGEPLLGRDSRDDGVIVKAGFSMTFVDHVNEAIVRLHDGTAPFLSDRTP